MKLLITRHGQTLENKSKILLGQNPGTLSSDGKYAVQKLKTRLISIQIDAVYSSDLQRCRDTTKILISEDKKIVKYDPSLREINFGKYQGKRHRTISNDYITNLNRSFPKGESNLQMIVRVIDAINEIYTLHRKQTVLLVSHAGPISVILGAYYNISFKEALDMKIDYCELIKVEINRYLQYPN